MNVTLKIAGVPSSAIGALHAAVAKVGAPDKWVVVEESKFNQGHDDYAVTLKIQPASEVRKRDSDDRYTRYRPVSAILSIFHAIDSNLLPAQETDIPFPETVARLKEEELRTQINDLEIELGTKTRSLRGQITQTTVHGHGARELLRTGDKYDEHENEYHFMGESIQRLLLPQVSNDPFVVTLKETQELCKKIALLKSQF